MSKPEDIVFYQPVLGVILLKGKWPKLACMNAEGLAAKFITVTENGHIKFTAKNAWAIYKLSMVQDRMGQMLIDRVLYHVDDDGKGMNGSDPVFSEPLIKEEKPQ